MAMKPIAVIQNSRNDGPALFATFAHESGLPLRLFRRFEGEAPPADMAPYAGLCVLGSPASANDERPAIRQLEALVRDSVARQRPVIGHCFGGQLLARALGGEITRAPHAEIGWSDIEALSDDWFGELRFPMVQWHYETFSIPPGAELIARGALCAHQAFIAQGLHIGMQFHCEVDAGKLESWLDAQGHEEIAASDSPGVQSPDAIRERARAALHDSARVARNIYRRWARSLQK